MNMKRYAKRFTALFLAVLMLAGTIPVSALSGEDAYTAQLREELAASVSEEEYPNGLFDFLTARMETSEDVASAEFTIVRRGNTEGEASVRFKAVDMSARYGEDYYIEVMDGLLADRIERNEDAPLFIEQADIGADDVVEAGEEDVLDIAVPEGTVLSDEPTEVSGEAFTAEDAEAVEETEDAEDAEAVEETETVEETENTEEPAEAEDTCAPKGTLLPEDDASGIGTLQGAVRLATGRDMGAYDWREDDRTTAEAFRLATAEMYDGVGGHKITLHFAPGEYQKVLRFHTVDDAVSEDDEQVLFVLSHPVNGAVSENPTGYMNIRDNDESETATYAFAKPEYTVGKNALSVTVELQRLTATARYTVVTVATAEGSAEAGTDYDPLTQELAFAPGQTAKEITLTLPGRSATERLFFYVMTEDGTARTKVNLEPAFEGGVTYMVTEPKAGVPSRDVLFNLQDMYYALGDRLSFANDYYIANHTSIRFTGGLNLPEGCAQGMQNSGVYAGTKELDLTMVNKIKIYSGENGNGTRYTYKDGCNEKTGYKRDKYNALSVNDTEVFRESGTYSARYDVVNLPDSARTQNASLTFSSLGYNGCSNTNGFLWKYIRLYYEPFFINTVASDSDAQIRPMVYTANGANPTPQKVLVDGQEKDRVFTAGTIELSSGGTQGYYFDNDTVTVVPKYNTAELTQKELDGIYLWGVKLERKASGSATTYYYLNRTSFSLRDLYDGKYKDFYTGETIGHNCLLNDGTTRGYKLLPVFRQKPAYTVPSLPSGEGIRFAQGTFTDDANSFNQANVIVTGRLDKIELNTVGTGDKVVQGWISVTESSVTESAMNGRYVDTKLKTSAMKETYDTRLADACTGLSTLYKNYKANPRSSSIKTKELNYQTAIPGHLFYEPTGVLNYVTASVMKPSITVTVNPHPDSTVAQTYGAVGYEEQVAQYEKTENGKAVGSRITIAPYTIKPYDLLSVYTGEPVPGQRFLTYWQDYTGDANMDGTLSAEEYAAMGTDVQNLYTKGTRIPFVGETYAYVPKLIGNSVLYYQINSVMEDPMRDPQTLSGKVMLRGNTVMDNSKQGGSVCYTPLAGVEVHAAGMQTTTNANGEWSISSNTLLTTVVYGVDFRYQGRVYTDTATVNQFAPNYIDEYDTFNVTDFRVRVGSKDLAAGTTTAEVEDTKMRFAFTVTPAVAGIDPSRIEVARYYKDGRFAASYEAYATQNKEWVIRTDDSLAAYQSGSADYSFNPRTEAVMPGDYFVITVYDQNDIPYVAHKVGFSFTAKLSAVSVLNSFLPPQAGVVFDFFDKIDASFDLGLVTTLDSAAEAGMKAAGIKVDDTLVDGVKTKTVSWGWSDTYQTKYKPDSDKKKSPADEAKDDVRAAAGELETVDTMPSVGSGSSTEDGAKVEKAESAAEEAVADNGKAKKNRSSFAAGIKLELRIAVSLQLAYDNDADKWYFEEFLVVGTVNGDASASYAYMTPIGVKLGIKATLSGNVTAMLGFNAYYADPSHPNRSYIDGSGSVNLIGASKGNTDINRKMSVYGKLIVRPAVELAVSAALLSDSLASVTLSGRAQFDMVFTTGNTGAGDVSLQAKLKLKLLGGLISKEWELAHQDYNMFSYANGGNFLMASGEDLRYDTFTADDVKQTFHSVSAWEGEPGSLRPLAVPIEPEDDRVLIDELDFDPAPLIESLCDDPYLYPDAPQSLVVFLDVKDGDSSKLVLKYSILQNGAWSAPRAVDPASQGDDSARLTWLGDEKILLSWTTYVGDPESTDTAELLNARKLRTAMFDPETGRFGMLRDLTRVTDADTAADANPAFVYYREDDGTENLMAVYRKSVYGTGGMEIAVGDVLNAQTVYAFRTYDFGQDMWNDYYDPGYLQDLLGNDYDAWVRYNELYYGQYFLDLEHYTDIREGADIFMDATEMGENGLTNDRGLGVWTEEPTEDDVAVMELSPRNRVVAMDAASYRKYGHNLGVFVYLVDFDGGESTVDDRELFVKVFDLTAKEEYMPFRLTKNAGAESSPILTDTNLGVNLFYTSDGSIVQTSLSDVLDSVLYGEKDFGGETLRYIVEDRSPEALVPEATIVAKRTKTDEDGETIEESYGDFAVEWSDACEILLYTQPTVTYKDGIAASDPEAALPENQFVEQQLYAKVHLFERYEMEQDGDILSAYADEWYPQVQVTAEQGLNVLSMDAASNGLFDIRYVGVQAKSVLGEIGGEPAAVVDTDNRSLVVATYDMFDEIFGGYGVEITLDGADEIYEYENDGVFPLSVVLHNPYFMGGEDMNVYVWQKEKDGSYTLAGEENFGSMYSYETVVGTVSVTMPEDLRDLDLYIEAWNGDRESGDLYGTYEYRYRQPRALAITGVQHTLLDRDSILYTVTVRNESTAELDAMTVRARLGDTEFTSEAFTIMPKSERTVQIELTCPDSAYTETRENGMITETAYITLLTDYDTREDALVRSAPEGYEELLEGFTLIDGISGAALGNTVSVKKGGYLLPLAATAGEMATAAQEGSPVSATALTVRPVSGNGSVASVDYIGGIGAKTAGTASVRLLIGPDVAGYTAVSGTSGDAVAYDDFNTLPSALVREVTLALTVANGDNGTGGGTGGGGGSTGGGGSAKPQEPVTPVNPKTGFIDVSATAYYADAVEWAAENHITAGITVDRFAPGRACTRGQIVTFLWRLCGQPAAQEAARFSDVAETSYCAEAVAWAVEQGITQGKTATRFAPNDTCTRAQAVTFLYRFSAEQAENTATFSDVPAGSYFAPAVAWAVENGITNGTGVSTFSPNGLCTRGQIVTFLYRYDHR